jgi:hypothetical protein
MVKEKEVWKDQKDKLVPMEENKEDTYQKKT